MATMNLSEAENKILACAWQCFKTGFPEIDYEKLSRMVGHTNSRSTSNAMAAIRKKLARMVEASAAPLTPSGSRAASPAKKTTAKKTPSKSAKEKDAELVTPTKRTPRSTAGKRKYKEESVSEEEDREGTVAGEDGVARDDSAVVVKREEEGEEEQEEGEVQEPKTPEMNTGVKVKGKKEGVKSPAKSPTKPRQTVTSGVRAAKKLKMEEHEAVGEGQGEGGADDGEL